MRVATACGEPGSEAHFFLVDPERFTQGQRDAKLTSDDCGTTQHYLLLDEFYRTALARRANATGGWCPTTRSIATTITWRRCWPSASCAPTRCSISVISARFRQASSSAPACGSYKAIDSPYKSLFAAAGGGLRQPVPAAALPGAGFQAGHLSWSHRPDELDPYIAAYHAIERYLCERGAQERLELARRCLYLKINRPLSRPPVNRNKSWQRSLLERLTRDWRWDERQFVLLDNRSQWKVRQVSQERRALVNELTYGYRFLSDFTRRVQATSPLTSRDLGVPGRRLYAAIERKAGKVEVVNLGISPDMSEDSLTLVHGYDGAGDVHWSLYQGQLTAPELPNYAPLKRARELLALLAWGHRNGVVDTGTHLSLFPGDSGLSEAELFALLSDLRRALPMPLPAVDEEALLAPSRPAVCCCWSTSGWIPRCMPPDWPAASRSSPAPLRIWCRAWIR